MVEKKRESERLNEAGQRRVLDQATRRRRLNRSLDALERDNDQEDPKASLPDKMMRLPQFTDELSPPTPKKKKKTRREYFKKRFRKTFETLLEEENLSVSVEPNYLTACVPPSSLPPRHLCSVCGFLSPYTCVTCGMHYCCIHCLQTHHDTRCLKWTA
uniref:Zinc finger HIT-type containing 1 n=1 Tax=Eptatretus burgeri TaxID=7764 RepID=A0A8C4R2X3_EPTBU